MDTQDRSQSDSGEYVHALIRLVRITSRWQFRRIRRLWRQFDATTGSETRTKTRRWANTARERGEAEIREFSDEAKKHFENVKPEIKAWMRKVRNLFELASQTLAAAFRYSTKGTVLILVLLGVIWMSGSLRGDSQSSDSQALCEDCQSPSDTGTSYEDADWSTGTVRTPNDDRSDSMNPNNDAYQASMDNRSNQLNPNNDVYQSSRR